MVLSPKSGLGRLLLFIIIVTTITYLVLCLASFGGTPWITTASYNVYYGVWKVCDFSNTTISDVCNQWGDSPYSTKYLTATFPNGKPGFIQSVQGLEITSLVLYIIAFVLIIVGIINLRALSFEIFFFAAAILLFLCIVFLAASLGLMSNKGRVDTRYDFLSWGWWAGLFGLLMIVIDFLALIGIIFAVNLSSSFKPVPGQQPPGVNKAHDMWHGQTGMHAQPNQSADYYNYNHYPQHNYSHENSQNPMMAYGAGNVPPVHAHHGSSYHPQQYDQSYNPDISQLASEFVWNPHDHNYQQQYSDPYGQYMQHHHPGYPHDVYL